MNKVFTHHPIENSSTRSFDIRNHLHNLHGDGGKSGRNETSYYCPVCNAKNFKVDHSSGHYGTYSCDCATTEEGKRKIRNAVAPPERIEKPTRPDSHKQYVYTDTENNPLIRVNIRYRNGKKFVWQQYLNNGEWLTPKQASQKGIKFNKEIYRSQVTPYNYQEVKKASQEGKTIFIVEGEEIVNRLSEKGITATTNLGGAGKWNEILTQHLANAGVREVIIHPDRDKAGINHADNIAASLDQYGIRYKWLYAFPNSPLWNHKYILDQGGDGLDLKDYLDNYPNMSKDDLFKLVELQRRQLDLTYKGSPQKSETKSKSQQIRELINNYINASDSTEQVAIKSEIQSRFKISKEDFTRLVDEANGLVSNTSNQPEVLTGKDLFAGDNPGIKWLIPGLLPIGGVTIVVADSGQGKTTLAYDCAGAVHFLETFLGEEPTKQGKVLILSSDEPKNFAIDKLANRGFSDEDDIVFVPGWTTDHWKLFEQAMSEHNPDLVIIDSFNSIHSDNNFDANSDRAAITLNQLNPILEKYDSACLLLHHKSKSQENKGVNKVRNSTAIAAAASMIWSLEGQNEVKTFQLEKTRGTEPLSLKVKMDAPNGKFNIVEGAVWDDETKSLSERIIALFKSLESNTRLEFEEVKSYISCNEKSLRKALERLTKLGILNKGKSKLNKRKSVWYLITNKKAPPSPSSDTNCRKETEITDTEESQKFDKNATETRQYATTCDSRNNPSSKKHSQNEKQTFDSNSPREGGECLDNDCRQSKDYYSQDTEMSEDLINQDSKEDSGNQSQVKPGDRVKLVEHPYQPYEETKGTVQNEDEDGVLGFFIKLDGFEQVTAARFEQLIKIDEGNIE